jgi:hypothetical protein
LNLSECELTSTGLATICAALQENTTLKALNLSANDCEDAGDAIAAMLRENHTLKHLDLDECWLSERSIAKICKALESNQALRGLRLVHNELTKPATEALVEALAGNTTLVGLWVGEPEFQGFPIFCDALEHNRTLLTFGLSYTSLNDEHCSRFARALAANSTLQALRLMSLATGGSDGDLHNLSTGLARNTSLLSLTVSSYHPLTIRDCRTLIDLLKRDQLEQLHLMDAHPGKESEYADHTRDLLNAISTNRRLIEFDHTASKLFTTHQLDVIQRVTSENALRTRLSADAGRAVGSLFRASGDLPADLELEIGNAFDSVSDADTVRNTIVAGWKVA